MHSVGLQITVLVVPSALPPVEPARTLHADLAVFCSPAQ